jgi:hypothetical protein
MWMGRGRNGKAPPETPADSGGGDSARAPGAELIRIDEVLALRDGGAAVLPVDVRSKSAWEESGTKASGAPRLDPDRPADSARVMGLPVDSWLVLYCT